MRRRVVITGMGVLTPLGHQPEELFRALIEGRSGVGPITAFDASTFPTRFAAEVKGFNLGRYVQHPERFAHARANTWFALAAAREALADAALMPGAPVDRTRFGLYLGVGEGVQDHANLISLVARNYREESRTLDPLGFTAEGLSYYHAQREAEQELHTASAHVAREFDLLGPNYNCQTACAAGSQALGEAAEMIRHGDAEVMLSGGSHSMINPLGVTGFNLLTALSTRNDAPTKASRPFDLKRDGFVIGEGAGVLVLEELEHAKRRGAPIHAELTGYGSTADAFRVTDSHPEGRGAIACMREALTDSGLTAADIGYINAHGTSTLINDKVETLAIKQVFGEAARQVPVSSTKSMLGHLIGAAGAVELVIGVLVLQRGVLPPTINYEVPDPDCDLDYIPNVAREQRVRHVLSNSFGFGGQNVSLIVSRFEG
ncbi:MAG: beta-ketoacyl-ACP synthase II [Gemmataceae bacterium]|nr:beta-ketoacyl-ACP synthase II [Gemmataceae bacterium]